MSNSPGRREVAHRLFAAEYDDASLEYAESDEERAPNYVVTPTGARINRLFVVGVLTSVEQVNEDTVRARIADPTGAFVVYAGQYQPDELAALQSLEAPAFVAITGKANTFEPEGSDRVLTSIRPESVTQVDADTRDRWAVTAAEHTLGRIETVADALGRGERGDELVAALRLDGVAPSLAEGVARAIDHYGTTADYLGALRELSLQAVEVVAGDRSEADSLDVAPGDETGQYAVGDLVESAPSAATAVTEVAGDVEDVVVDDVGADADADSTSDSEPSIEEGDTEDDVEDDVEADVGDDVRDDVDTTPESSAAGTDAAESNESTDATGDATESAEDTADLAESNEGTTAAADADETTGTVETTSESTGTDEPADSDGASSTDDVGGVDDFDGGSSLDDAEGAVDHGADDDSADDEIDDAGESTSDEMYEVDEEERERIEEEYGVGFESGTEVDEPGEAGIDAPVDPEDVDEDGAGTATSSTEDAAGASATADEPDAEGEETDDADADGAAADDAATEEGGDEEGGDGDATDDAADVDLEAALLDQMEALDEGEGAERDDLVEAVAAETGAADDAVEDAIEDALMSGKCYEPSDGTYKPI